ncbi:MAG: ribosomal protein S18-alanine N-acetyltransferase [Lachnospiraceae bacterium]|nr:ribosomal protein S18-alanine N-acetyltransferase [Lachnospiraceae bacterium]
MYQIKRMDEDNVEGVALLEKDNFTDGWSLESLKEEIDNPDALYLVIEDDENKKTVASAGLIVSFDTADIMNVSVSKDYRRQSLAYKLLTKLIEEGRKIGVREFTLEVREGNAPARALYEKLGFKCEGIRPDFYSNPKEGAAIYWLR